MARFIHPEAEGRVITDVIDILESGRDPENRRKG